MVAIVHAGTQEVGSQPQPRALLHGSPFVSQAGFHTGGEIRASTLAVSECVCDSGGPCPTAFHNLGDSGETAELTPLGLGADSAQKGPLPPSWLHSC